MTVIAAMVQGRLTHMAGDSCVGVGEQHRVYTSTPKVWRQGCCVLGSAGDAVFDLALAGLSFESPSWVADELLLEFRRACRAVGVDTDCGLALIGCRGRLWLLADTLMPLSDRVAAIGSGADVAIGFLLGSQLTPANRVTSACRAASERAEGCGGRITQIVG